MNAEINANEFSFSERCHKSHSLKERKMSKKMEDNDFNQRILAKNEDVYRKLMFKFKHMYPLLRTDHPKSYKMSDMLWLRDKCKFVSLTANRTEQINVSQLKL